MKKQYLFIILIANICVIPLMKIISAENCPWTLIYSNPIGTIGTSIECRSTIVHILSAMFPQGVLMKSDDYFWYCEIYQTPIPPGILIKGKSMFVKGQYLGRKKILYEGSSMEIPLVFATKIEK